MTKNSIDTLEVSNLPNARADSTVFVLRLYNSQAVDSIMYAYFKDGEYSVFGSLFDLLLYTENSDSSKRLGCFGEAENEDGEMDWDEAMQTFLEQY